MKSSWEKLRGLALSQHQNHRKDDERVFSHHRPCPKLLDDFTQASKELHDMKKCEDTIVYAAAAAANSAFEFSESLREMGTCLLEQSALTGNEQSGNLLRMLSKVQFELQELVDNYRSHIFQTTTLAESVINQLQTVEETKRQCDEKRNVYQDLLAAQKKMEKPRSGSPLLQVASIDYELEAICFVSGLESLKEGHTRSLLTQAVQHHAAQVRLFSKGLKSLKAIGMEVGLVAERLHNDQNSCDPNKETCASLSGYHNSLRYTSHLELKKREKNLRADNHKESNNDRARNELHSPSSSAKLGELRDVRLTQTPKVWRGDPATTENWLTPLADVAYPVVPLPPQSEYTRGQYIPSTSDARFYHSAPMGRTSDLSTPSIAASYPKLPILCSENECQSSHFVTADDERRYHSARG